MKKNKSLAALTEKSTAFSLCKVTGNNTVAFAFKTGRFNGLHEEKGLLISDIMSNWRSNPLPGAFLWQI